MKKIKFCIATLLLAGSSLTFNSCIGSFSLTKNVMDWNQGVGSKFVNELVFFAFWILPVYEVTALADMLVLNNIEFWSGENPMSASTKVIESEHGRYLISCDGKGYDIIHEETGFVTRLDFDVPTQTWSVEKDGTSYPFMTFIDSNHVKMITPERDMRIIELSDQGLQAYAAEVSSSIFLANL